MTHMTDRDARPKIGEQPAPVMNVKTVVDAFTVSLSHERKVSEAIRELYRLAQTEGDIDSIPMLNWFIEEQVEEEATVSEILDRLKLVGDDGSGILRLDRELGARTSAGE